MAIIDFQPHRNRQLYCTDEYVIYIRGIAMGAGDPSLAAIVANVIDLTICAAAKEEIARRIRIEG